MDNPLMRKHMMGRTDKDRIAELEAEVAAKDAALRRVEFVDDEAPYCPWCKEPAPGYGHATDCPRQAALSGDAGKRLLEAVRVLAALAEEYHDGHGRLCKMFEPDDGDACDCGYGESRAARATLRDLGVLEGE